MKIVAIVLATVLMPLAAQEIKLSELDKLAAKADESVNVTLDGAMLKLAGRFMSGHGDDDARVKKVLSGIDSIMVRSFEFSSEGSYAAADLDAVRAQAKGPQWSRIVGVTSRRDDDNVEVYFKDAGNGNLGGILVLCAEPRALTVVSISGTLDPSELADLSGHFGIPKLELAIAIHGRKGAR